MTRAYNFCAGPAALPEEVLRRASEEMLDYQGRGLSVMEMSHRAPAFVEIAEQAEQDLRELLAISDDYAVLFLQGGASLQFAMAPINLLGGAHKADYINTGQWSKKAIKEARKFCEVNVAASSEADGFTTAPEQSELRLSDDAAYVHYTPNETIGGVAFPYVPRTDKPLVADMSSTILSRPIDVSKFGVIYAGAQKNIGPAGVTVVIVRKDLLDRAPANTPAMLHYKTQADAKSMYNTPPTYALYLAGLVFQWLKDQGGVAGIARVNERKAKRLYDYIDGSDFYRNPVREQDRSWMNVPFVLADDSLDQQFLEEAERARLLNLKGHRSVGGMRASLYNAVPEAAVDALLQFMDDFARKHG